MAAVADEAAVAAVSVTRHQGGLLAAVSAYQRYARQRNDLPPVAEIDETTCQDVIYEENGVPYINSDLARRNDQKNLNSKFAKLVESVTGGSSPPPLRQQDKP
jgi:hypothetical protein